jgi:hypothetical protein
MKTFGELVTQIKRSVLELCEDLLIPGGSQSLGPAHAYGKSYLIRHSVRRLQEAMQHQDAQLQSLVGKESSSSSVQTSDPRLWRLVDSIFQSLALIDRYIQDPSPDTRQGLAEWLKQEGTNAGLDASFMEVSGEEDELNISGKGFTLVFQLSGQDSVLSAYLVVIRGGEALRFDLPDLVEHLGRGNKLHVSHLLSMAARLDLIECDTQFSLVQHVMWLFGAHAIEQLPFELSLGGFRLPIIGAFHAVLTFDAYEQQNSYDLPTLMVVVDPPVICPTSQIQELSMRSGVPIKIAEASVAASISDILRLQSDVVRILSGRVVRLLLTDESKNSILVARVPIAGLDALDPVLDFLKIAAGWRHVIEDAFSTNEKDPTNIAIDVAPVDFRIGVTFWVRESPERLSVEIRADGSLTTDSDDFNAAIGGATDSFPDIIAHLLD